MQNSQFFAKQSILCVKNAILWFWLCASGNFLPLCCTWLVGAKSFGTQAGRAGASQITWIGCMNTPPPFLKNIFHQNLNLLIVAMLKSDALCWVLWYISYL
jgi:hypothetical protein